MHNLDRYHRYQQISYGIQNLRYVQRYHLVQTPFTVLCGGYRCIGKVPAGGRG